MADGRSARVIHTGLPPDRSAAGSIKFGGVVGTASGNSATVTHRVPESNVRESVILCLVGWAWRSPDGGSVIRATATNFAPVLNKKEKECWTNQATGIPCIVGWTNLDTSTGIDFAGPSDLYPIAVGTPVTRDVLPGETITWDWSGSTPTGFEGVLVYLLRGDAYSPSCQDFFRIVGDAPAFDEACPADPCVGGKVTNNGTPFTFGTFTSDAGYYAGLVFEFGKTTNVTDDNSTPIIFFGHGNVIGDPGTPSSGSSTIFFGPVTSSPDAPWDSVSVVSPINYHEIGYIGYRVIDAPVQYPVDWEWACPGTSVYDLIVRTACFSNQWANKVVYGLAVTHRDRMPCCNRGIIVADRFRKATADEQQSGAQGGGNAGGGLGNWQPGENEPAKYAPYITAQAPNLTYPVQGNAIKAQLGLPQDGKQYFGAIAHNGEVVAHDGGLWIEVKFRDPPNAGNTIEVRVG